MNFRVQKYGGSSLSTPDQIKTIALRIREAHAAHENLIIIVSAMGHTTDELCSLSQKITLIPSRRELDMLLSTGERISMALMSMALNAIGVPAVSFTGSQAGILTDDSHNNARIIDITPFRLENELKKNHVVVLAGFQGVNPTTKEITTLGRGGSDLTAVAMAHYFKSSACEIMKDVDGIYSIDPRLVPVATHHSHLHFDHVLELTFWGSQILHYRSVELAQRLRIPIRIRLAEGHVTTSYKKENSTLIDGEKMNFEKPGLVSVNSHTNVWRVISTEADWPAAMNGLEGLLNKNNLPWPQLLDSENRTDGLAFYLTAPSEQLVSMKQILEQPSKSLRLESDKLASVTATAFGLVGSDLSWILIQGLKDADVVVQKINFSSRSITAFIDHGDREKALLVWHKHIVA